jgi:hypothetical protein
MTENAETSDVETDVPPSDIRNAYPELPVLDYAHSTVAMSDVVTYMGKSSSTVAVRRGAYVIFRNESGGGQSGINNNFIGLQADGDRHPEKYTPLFCGTCLHRESMTGNWRRFVCFKTWQGSVDVMCGEVNDRGLYVGGYAHPYANMNINTVDDWPLAYYREWVEGDSSVNIPDADKRDLLQQYQAAVGYFPSGMVEHVMSFARSIFGMGS